MMGNEIFRRDVFGEFSVAADVGTGIRYSVRGLREIPHGRAAGGFSVAAECLRGIPGSGALFARKITKKGRESMKMSSFFQTFPPQVRTSFVEPGENGDQVMSHGQPNLSCIDAKRSNLRSNKENVGREMGAVNSCARALSRRLPLHILSRSPPVLMERNYSKPSSAVRAPNRLILQSRS
jgi:hypothetical protein